MALQDFPRLTLKRDDQELLDDWWGNVASELDYRDSQYLTGPANTTPYVVSFTSLERNFTSSVGSTDGEKVLTTLIYELKKKGFLY